ncbi:MAG: hypothetical protein IJN86_08220 [Clostridia bacterium]|nr:hypothetical protein [Clostridia bacterium]
MRKSIFIFICLCLAAVLALTSCARIKSAVGIDRMENADVGIIPDNNSSGTSAKDPHTEQNQVVSVGPTEEIEKNDSPYFKIGDPMLIDLSPKDEKGSTIFQYTVTNVEILTDLDGIDNIIMKIYEDENGNIQTRNLADYLNEDGKLKDDYFYVVVDINTKYISGYDEVRDELYHGKLGYDCEPAAKKEVVTEHENGITSISYVFLDENGNEFRYPEYIGGHSSFYREDGSKDANHMYLKIGEEINWQVGKILEKSLVEKYGAVFAINSSTKVELPIDLSEYD